MRIWKLVRMRMCVHTVPPSPQELRQCYSDMKSQLQQQTRKQTKTPKKRPPTSPALSDSEAAPGWVEVATDILLGYLSQSSQLWRSVVEQVFRRLVHRVTPGVVHLIAKVSGWVSGWVSE